MTQRPSRRAVIAALTAGLAWPGMALASSAPATSLFPVTRPSDFRRRSQPSVERLIAEARLQGDVCFAVANTATGDILETHRGRTALPPASVAKALTAAYALRSLGPDHRFVTRVIATGGISGGVVTGDLILAGGGDPTLDTDALADLAAQVKAAGIREVRGAFRVWGGALPFQPRIDPGQPDHVGYDPAVSGLNLNYNRVHFEWRRGGSGYSVSMDARSDRHRPAVQVAQMSIVSRSAPVYTYESAGGRDRWTVASGALGNGGARWLPVRKPEIYAGEVFQTFARAHGIVLSAPVQVDRVPQGHVLAEHRSAQLRILARDMLKWSTNLTAEAVGMAASLARGARVRDLADSARAMNAWARSEMGLRAPDLVDHSGLGDASRISAEDMTRALLYLRRRSGLKTLMKPFSLRDDDGQILRNHPIDVHAKTGTLNFVSGLGGYIDLPGGTELAFAIFTADLERRASLSRAQRERPDGARLWNRRAKVLQSTLIERWGVLYGSA